MDFWKNLGALAIGALFLKTFIWILVNYFGNGQPLTELLYGWPLVFAALLLIGMVLLFTDYKIKYVALALPFVWRLLAPIATVDGYVGILFNVTKFIWQDWVSVVILIIPLVYVKLKFWYKIENLTFEVWSAIIIMVTGFFLPLLLTILTIYG